MEQLRLGSLITLRRVSTPYTLLPTHKLPTHPGLLPLAGIIFTPPPLILAVVLFTGWRRAPRHSCTGIWQLPCSVLTPPQAASRQHSQPSSTQTVTLTLTVNPNPNHNHNAGADCGAMKVGQGLCFTSYISSTTSASSIDHLPGTLIRTIRSRPSCAPR